MALLCAMVARGVQEFYGFNDSFCPEQLFARSAVKKRHIYYTCDLIKDLIKSNDVETLRVINCGVKVLTLSDAKEAPTRYRLCSEGIKVVYPVLEKRVAFMTLEDIYSLMEGDGIRITRLSDVSQGQVLGITKGCMVLSYLPGGEHDVGSMKGKLACPLQILAWRSDSFVKPLINKDERHMINHLLYVYCARLFYKLAKFKTSNCSGQRGLSSALPVIYLQKL